MTPKKFLLLTLTIGVAVGGFLVLDTTLRDLQPPCLFRTWTGIPCPGCGMWRALSALVQGEVKTSLYLNPMAVVCLTIVLLLYLTAGVDTFCKTQYYNRLQNIRISHWGYCILGAIVVLNWLWNIYKYN